MGFQEILKIYEDLIFSFSFCAGATELV